MKDIETRGATQGNTQTNTHSSAQDVVGATFATKYLPNLLKQFLSYKHLAELSMEQLSDDDLFWKPNEISNSIAILIQHMAGNMLSRFTDFLTTDGEKPWRQRDAEFDTVATGRSELLNYWNKGWNCLLQTVASLTEEDLAKTIYIRKEPHTVTEALNRQLTHYPYHVGQIVYIAKELKGADWRSISIPLHASQAYNDAFFKRMEAKHASDS